MMRILIKYKTFQEKQKLLLHSHSFSIDYALSQPARNITLVSFAINVIDSHVKRKLHLYSIRYKLPTVFRLSNGLKMHFTIWKCISTFVYQSYLKHIACSVNRNDLICAFKKIRRKNGIKAKRKKKLQQTFEKNNMEK